MISDKRYLKMELGPVPTFVKGPDGNTRKVACTNTPEDLIGSFIEDGFVKEEDRYQELYLMYKHETKNTKKFYAEMLQRKWAKEYADNWVTRWEEWVLNETQ